MVSNSELSRFTMVICSLLASLHICLEMHPPLASFFCLLSLAVAFVGFAVYIQSHDIHNPDVKEADRTLCSQRLMTSAFLLCLCAMLCCAAGLYYRLPKDKWGQI